MQMLAPRNQVRSSLDASTPYVRLAPIQTCFFSGAVEDCEKVCDPKDKENRQCETKELMTKVSIIARSLSNTLLIAKCDGQTADMIAVDAVYPKSVMISCAICIELILQR